MGFYYLFKMKKFVEALDRSNELLEELLASVKRSNKIISFVNIVNIITLITIVILIITK
jgi:hypothetical protein